MIFLESKTLTDLENDLEILQYRSLLPRYGRHI